MKKDKNQRPRVVIIGAGFAGLWACREFHNKPVDVVLIDLNNYHTFLPLLYQVAAAEIEPEAIAFPVRSFVRNLHNINFNLGRVISINTEQQTVETQEASFPYDYLIIATGSKEFFFGAPGAQEYAFPLKSVQHGTNLRNHILRCFERAETSPTESERKRALTFAIVGGGPTGVEYAGALEELIRVPLRRDHPMLNIKDVRVILIEAGPDLLDTFPKSAREYGLRRLKKMGVEVLLSQRAAEVRQNELILHNGDRIPTSTVIWTAGVQGAPPDFCADLPTVRGNRITVKSTLQIESLPNIYVAGDLALIEKTAVPLPMVAPVAIQQGTHAAKNILQQASGKPVYPFEYWDKGSMATIGRNAAVAVIKEHVFIGFIAWLMWLVVHISYLIGFRNRLIVLLSWAWDYFFYDRPIRIILPGSSVSQPVPEEKEPPVATKPDAKQEPAVVK